MARKTGSHAEITGPAIREAALRLFARDGYAAVSMRQIAADVGVRAGALYLYTPDKQTLLFDLMRTHLEALLGAWEEEALALAPDPLARLQAFTRFHMRFHLDRPDAVFLAYMELRNLTPDNFKAIEKLRDRYEAILSGILTEGLENGTFQVADVKVTTMALIALLNGIGSWFRDGGRLSRGRIEEVYLDMVERMVVA